MNRFQIVFGRKIRPRIRPTVNSLVTILFVTIFSSTEQKY